MYRVRNKVIAMRMLDDLKSAFDEIQPETEWEYNFVQDMAIKMEENPDFKLSKKQFAKLNDLHQKYCKGWRI